MGHMNMTKSPNAYLNKLPMVTALFWVIKIVATTLGESVSNYFAITPLKLGYAVSAGIFVVLFAVTLIVQMRVDRFRPAVFWSVILATSILGTSVSDFMNRTVGLGYTGGFAVLTTCLVVALAGGIAFFSTRCLAAARGHSRSRSAESASVSDSSKLP